MERSRRASSSSALSYLKKPFSWRLGALKLRRSKSTEVASFPVFDPSTATTFDNENSNFVSFNSELDSAVTQYLSQVTELGYRPTNGGSNLSSFKADWKDKNNSVASVNSRTSERLLAVQFQLNSSERRNLPSTVDTENRRTEDNGAIEITREEILDVNSFDENVNSEDSPVVDNINYPNFSEGPCAQENFYENGNVSVTDEPIYENLDASLDEVFNKEPLYDIVPRRPQVPPKPESLARTISQENEIDSSSEELKCCSISEDSQCADDISGDSLSAESLTDFLTQDIERNSKKRKKKNREQHTEQSCSVDGSETSDLGSSGSEDVPSIDEWPSTTSRAATTVSVSYEVEDIRPTKPEIALELLEDEVLAELELEKSLGSISHIDRSLTAPILEQISDEEDSIQAINSSIVEVCRSRDEIDEARIIDDVGSYSEDLIGASSIRHSVIIELKDSDKISPCTKQDLKRSGSLHVSGSNSEKCYRKSKSCKKKNRRMSETGIGISVGVIHNAKTNTKEFHDLSDRQIRQQVIEICDDGTWGLKKGDEETDLSLDIEIQAAGPEFIENSSAGREEIDKTEEAKQSINDCKTTVNLTWKKAQLPTDNKKKIKQESSLSKKKSPKMEECYSIAAPPQAFSNPDGSDGVFSASCVALNSEPNSLASVTGESVGHRINANQPINTTTKANSPSPSKKKEPFWNEAAKEDDGLQKDLKSNLGLAIMESYDKEMNKKRESLNLPEVSMLDFGQSAFDLEVDRKNVIKQMIVKTKKKQSWFGGPSATDMDASVPKKSSFNVVKRSNSMSSVSGVGSKSFSSRNGKEMKKDMSFLNMKSAASRIQRTSIGEDEDDIVFPSFMSNTESSDDKNSSEKCTPAIEPIPNIELTIKKLGVDQLTPLSPSYKLNKHLTAITPFKPPSQNKHSSIKNIKASLPIDAVPAEECAQVDIVPSPVTDIPKGNPDQKSLEEIIITDQPASSPASALFSSQVDIDSTAHESGFPEQLQIDIPETKNSMDEISAEAAAEVETLPAPRAKGEVDGGSILQQKALTKLYWEKKMATAAQDDLGWEPVANVCFRDPNAQEDTPITEDPTPAASGDADFLPAPPPQFDNTPPESIQDNDTQLHPKKIELERIVSLDDEISVLEREVLGDIVASDVEDDVEEEVVKQSLRENDERTKRNLKYVYGEEGVQELSSSVTGLVQNGHDDPDRVPTVKHGHGEAQVKVNVIEAEIRAQQERERELQLEQMKKKAVLEKNLQNSNKTKQIRHKDASSPHDSDEGFVDPPVERPSNVLTSPVAVNTDVGGTGYTHTVTDHDGEPVIYDAVEPVMSNKTAPEARVGLSSPVSAKPPPAASNTTETKIALEIRELKEREEELRRMRELRQGLKKTQNVSHNNSNNNTKTNNSLVNGNAPANSAGNGSGVHSEEFFAEEYDGEDHGSSSSREILDDHLTSLTTTTDEGNFSECGDATSSEDKSSNGSNSRIVSPEVPAGEYPRPSRRVTVRPFQADDEDERPVYTR
ncbi:uncharacterized protein LOC108675756, partial [Hyalella azteca]|uniref:Uncharacterized protein LOC108675756 n=1 Tax=Hyalella azteca TaxID=294128 RepID=A0A8B7NZL7_HYAAZ